MEFKETLPKDPTYNYVKENMKFVKHLPIQGEVPLLTSEIGLILGVAEYEGKTYVAILEPATLKVFVNRITGDYKTVSEISATSFEDIVQDDIYNLIVSFFEEENIISNLAITQAISDYILRLAGKDGLTTSVAYSALRDAIKETTLGTIAPGELRAILLNSSNTEDRLNLLLGLIKIKQQVING